VPERDKPREFYAARRVRPAMYVAESSRPLLEQRRSGGTGPRRRARIARTVVLLGLTSLFTDVSAEMVSTILPVYVVFGLGAAPLAFGLLDGLYQGASSLVRLASGVVSDRGGHKSVAVAGYGLSAITRIGLIAVGGSVPGLAALIFADRTGKGIRTAPRDAMISLSTPREELGRAFGVHRAMDTAGALLGPLIAVGVLLLAPRRYDAVFVVSLAFALIGFAILALYVRPPARRAVEDAPRASLRSALALLRDRRFRLVTVAGTLLALVTISDGFIYLGLQRHLDFQPTLLPLLYVGTSLAYMLLAVPAGRLADRIGRTPVFLGGYVLLILVYSSLLLPHLGGAAVVLYLAAFGAFYAATDGVLAALGSALVPEHLRASGLALLVAFTSLGRLVASVIFGLSWTLAGMQTAVVLFAAGLVLAAAGSIVLLTGSRARA
jgi:MFS family permease